ncbi:ABC transporter [Nocardioides sp. Soil797]|nr:ABC transporter [Nocardioides sp. Soil797]
MGNVDDSDFHPIDQHPAARERVVEVSGLSVVYGAGSDAVHTLKDLTFSVDRGELLCIVGPSGCGKTTLLKSVCGLLVPTSGSVTVAGHAVDGPPPEVALVFQDYTRSLMPWKTVLDNVIFPLRAKRMSRAESRSVGLQALDQVGLGGFESKYPWQLSGGMQQRVAIARGVAYQPEVLLMDEPFASVDAQTRAELEDLVLELRRNLGMTVIFVTHDIDESVYMGDRVIVLSSRPTTVKENLEVGLPVPRDQVFTKQEPEFVRLRTDIASSIRSQH